MSLEHNSEIKWENPEKLKPNPKNNNRHSIEQIERLAKILKYQGWRSPITISNRSGFVVTGHARLEAALLLGILKVPVSYQDFDDEAQEYAHMTADNEIARWAQLDFQEFKIESAKFDIDKDFFGIKDFEIKEKNNQESQKEKEIFDEEKYMILIECDDEYQQQQLFNELFNQRNLQCKIMS